MKKLRINMVSESDISVQSHGVHTAYVEMASALERRPDVELIRGEFNKKLDVDIVHLHTIGMSVWKKLFQKGPKKVISAHIIPASLIGSIVGAGWWYPLAKIYMRWIYGRADKVLAVSGTVAKVLHDDLNIDKDKIEVFYNTVDMTQYKPSKELKTAARKKLKIAKDDFVVVGNGQVQPRKRLDIFIYLAKKFPEMKFFWVGGIPFKLLGADLIHMTNMMNNLPKNMIITGVIPHAEVHDYLMVADVFCLPSEQENHPMCVLEAAGAELPIVLMDIHEYNDTFKGDAILCKKNKDFADALLRLKNDKKFYKRQLVGTKKIALRFDSANNDRLVAMYRQLIK